MRTATVNFVTENQPVAGQFVPAGYLVSLFGSNLVFQTSPAVFPVPANIAAGEYTATVTLIAQDGTVRGPTLSVPVSVAEDQTIAAVPVSGSATVVLS